MAWHEKIRVGISHHSVVCMTLFKDVIYAWYIKIKTDCNSFCPVLGNGSHFCATSTPWHNFGRLNQLLLVLEPICHLFRIIGTGSLNYEKKLWNIERKKTENEVMTKGWLEVKINGVHHDDRVDKVMVMIVIQLFHKKWLQQSPHWCGRWTACW